MDKGFDVHFGDASRRAVLDSLGLTRARAAVVTISDPLAVRRAVALIRQINPDIRILVRVNYVAESAELEALGADDVLPAELEVSVEIFARLLRYFGVPRHLVRMQEAVVRADHYRALRGHPDGSPCSRRAPEHVRGHHGADRSGHGGSRAADKTLIELDLRRRTGITIVAIVREGESIPFDPSVTLQAGDFVVLMGPHETIDNAVRELEPLPASVVK